MNVTEPIRRIARESPGRIAIVRRRGGTISYGDLDRAIDFAAHRFHAERIGPGDIVQLAMTSHNHLVVFQLALARIGAAASTPTLPVAFATACLAESPAEAPSHPRTMLLDDGWFPHEGGAPVAPVAMHEGDGATAIVIQSSGTTSAQKNVAVSHRMLQSRIDAQGHGIPMPADVRQICVRRASSSYGFSVRMRVLQAGGALLVATTADEVIAMAERHRANRLVLPPYWLERIDAALPPGSRALASVEQVEAGGSFVPEPLYLRACERICPVVYTNYGVTESGYIAAGLMSALDRAAGEVGRTAPGIEIETLDDAGRVLPAGEVGVLRVRSTGCTTGYVDAPEASKETFRDGWVVTGDMGRVRPDGTVTLGGRLSEHIDIGGYKISPRPIEEALLSVEAIVDAATFGATGPNGIAVLGAAIVARGPLDRDEIARAMRTHSPSLAPTFLMQVPAIPRNEGGKVLRRELAAMAEKSGAAR